MPPLENPPSLLERTSSLGSSDAPVLTEEELLRQGNTRSEAGRNLVEQNVNQMARERLLRTLGFALCFFFMFVVAPLALGIMGVVIWASIALNLDKDASCDTPIRTYLWGIMVILIWSSWLQNLFIEYVCDYDQERDGAERPTRVKIYQYVYLACHMTWNILGLVWVTGADTCSDTAPHMYMSAKVLSILMLVAYITLFTGFVVLYYFAWQVRYGSRVTADGAGEGFIDKLEVVNFVADDFDDEKYPKVCCICMEDFGTNPGGEEEEKLAIVKTPCGHVYHKACLGNWLKGARQCPMCRTDLVDAVNPGSEATGEAAGEAEHVETDHLNVV